MRRSLTLNHRGDKQITLNVEEIHKMGEVHKGGNALVRTTIWMKNKKQFYRVRHSIAEIEALCPGISRVVRVLPPLKYEEKEKRKKEKVQRRKEKQHLKQVAQWDKAAEKTIRKRELVVPKGCKAPKRICIKCLTTRITRRQHTAWERRTCDGCAGKGK